MSTIHDWPPNSPYRTGYWITDARSQTSFISLIQLGGILHTNTWRHSQRWCRMVEMAWTVEDEEENFQGVSLDEILIVVLRYSPVFCFLHRVWSSITDSLPTSAASEPAETHGIGFDSQEHEVSEQGPLCQPAARFLKRRWIANEYPFDLTPRTTTILEGFSVFEEINVIDDKHDCNYWDIV